MQDAEERPAGFERDSFILFLWRDKVDDLGVGMQINFGRRGSADPTINLMGRAKLPLCPF
jgi:hypothetical protein